MQAKVGNGIDQRSALWHSEDTEKAAKIQGDPDTVYTQRVKGEGVESSDRKADAAGTETGCDFAPIDAS